MPVIMDIAGREAEIEIYTALTRRQLKNRDLFICEGIKAIELALKCGLEPVSLMLERRHVSGKAAHLIQTLGELPVFAPDDETIRRVTGFELSRGVLCAMKRPKERGAEEVVAGARRVAVLEYVNDDTNVGAIFRSAAALGMDAVLLTEGSADPLSRRSVRVSMGAVFTLPFAMLPENGIALLKKEGFTCAALALDRNSVPISEFYAEKCALFLGSEGQGLKRETVENCDARVVIPMSRGIDSLNVAAAAAIAFYSIQK